MPTSSDYERMLRLAALRVTRPRVAALAVVHAHSHADTDTILGAVRTDAGEMSHQALYDVLKVLTTARPIRRIQPAGHVARYESQVGDNHHHVVGRTCGVIADADCAVGSAPGLTASDEHGFVIDEAEVIHWGQCSDRAAAPIS
ncbi:transcriptional repressor [Kutzneria sp. NPDC051319]|uniref:Fur family transcriptional regulator n=1 Tax=Kutzneria sp. NPDC051319 TaxID=3155047 RepID=UPI00343AA9B0